MVINIGVLTKRRNNSLCIKPEGGTLTLRIVHAYKSPSVRLYDEKISTQKQLETTVDAGFPDAIRDDLLCAGNLR